MIKIAFRNVFRNRRRTLLSLLLIAVGTAALFVVRGYVDSAYLQLRQLAINTYGDLQIARSSYWDNTYRGYSYLIKPQELGRIEVLLRKQPQFDQAAAQLSVSGLIGNQQGSTNLLALGVQPERWKLPFPLSSGRSLRVGDLGQALIGEAMAQRLGVGIGDYLSLAVTTVNGAFNAGSVKVVGIFKGLQPAENGYLGFIPLKLAQRLLGTVGVGKLIVQLRSAAQAAPVAHALQQALDASAPASASNGSFQVKTWSDLAVFYHQVQAFWKVMFGFMTTAIFILVLFSIMEVMTMSFFERMREIGTIKAIGTRRYQIFTLFSTEGILLGLLGGVLGLGLGWLLGWLINLAYITYTPPGFTVEIPITIRLAAHNLTVPFLTAFISTVLSTLLPAVKAARTRIVDALRYV